MKRYFLGLITLLFAASFAQSQTLDEVLEAHHEAMGLESAKAINTLVIRGTAMQMGMEFPMTIYQKRTADGVKMRTQIEFQGRVLVPSAFNGESGWKRMLGMEGGMEVQDLSPEELAQMKNTRIEGEFYQWQKRGRSLELLGEEEFEGSLCYAIKSTQEDGSVSTYYLDQESYIMVGQTSQGNMNGQDVTVTQSMGDYDIFGGVAIPMSMQTSANGQQSILISIEEIVVNEPIADELFERPEE